jgi:enoyl-CoA hydratase/carnithine racemase
MSSLEIEHPRDGIAVLRLNRPDVRNALDSATLALLGSAMAELAADQDLRALVFSTTSTRALCAGADVREPLSREEGVARMEAFGRLYAAVEAFPTPTIAVCVGNCVGAGAELVAGVDLRVGGDNLKLAWAGARLGVPVGPARLTPLVGLAKAKELIYTGRVVECAEADRLGLLAWSGPADQAEAAALDLGDRLAAQSADGLRVLKRLFREQERTAERVALENAELERFQREGAGLPAAEG